MNPTVSNKFYTVHICPILSDNFSYIVVDHKTKTAAIVDPAEPSKLKPYLEKHSNDFKLTCIWTTHKHWDHAGGNEEMIKAYPELLSYGPSHESEPVKGVNKPVKDGDVITLGNLQIQTLETPCHTKGHVQYFVKPSSVEEGDEDVYALFSGDTFFVGGCGRFFEGDAEQMYSNVQKVKKTVPASTRMYCGHEYTVKNLEFALSVDGENKDLKQAYESAKQKRAKGEFTVPSLLSEEYKHNLFMKTDEAGLQKLVGGSSPVEALKILRQMKDKY